MPRGFSKNQAISFREKLIETAYSALTTTGVRKTTVADLAREAGLSTGAFYKFFPSKEAAFFEAYEAAEERLKAEFIEAVQGSDQFSPLMLQQTLQQLARAETIQVLLRFLQNGEMEYTLRAVDPQRIERHTQGDYTYLRSVIDLLKERGIEVKIGERALLDYLQALFILCYQRDQYCEHADRIIDAFIRTLINEAIA